MVKERLLQPDAQEKGWLLDGYPTSCSEAMTLETLVIRPDIFILLVVPDETIVERVVERQLDPVTGKIYHLKYSPAENEEIASRLTQRFDDTEEKAQVADSISKCLSPCYQYMKMLQSRMGNTSGHLIQAMSKYLIHLPWLLLARHTTLPLLEALLRWRESESPKGAMMPRHTKRRLVTDRPCPYP